MKNGRCALELGFVCENARISAGLTLMDLSARLGFTYQQLVKYEKGENSLRATKLQQLGRILNIPVSQFYDSRDDKLPVTESMPGNFTAIVRSLQRIERHSPQEFEAIRRLIVTLAEAEAAR
jgi:transcriptional regulator with XRE-family HTH domain